MKMLLALAVVLASVAASDYALAGGSDYNTENRDQYDSHIWHGR
ncbi:MAG: hypothetical protein U1E20_13175 [Methylocystis sp.]